MPKTEGQEIAGDSYVALQLDESVGVGDSVVVVATASTEDELMDEIGALTGSAPARVCVVELKRMLARRMMYEISADSKPFLTK